MNALLTTVRRLTAQDVRPARLDQRRVKPIPRLDQLQADGSTGNAESRADVRVEDCTLAFQLTSDLIDRSAPWRQRYNNGRYDALQLLAQQANCATVLRVPFSRGALAHRNRLESVVIFTSSAARAPL
jgi:hypothetical protein